MKQKIAHITVVVDDYDKAIEFYTQKLNFILIEDALLNESKRWVLIAPLGSTECCLLLAKAANAGLVTYSGFCSSAYRRFIIIQAFNNLRDSRNFTSLFSRNSYLADNFSTNFFSSSSSVFTSRSFSISFCCSFILSIKTGINPE